MLKLGQAYILAFAHFSPRLRNQSTFLTGKDIIGIDQTLRLDQHAILFLSERH